MILRPILWFGVLFLHYIGHGVANNVDGEQRQLERNLKVLRNDFNKLVETVEDFAGDFFMQVHDAGKLMQNTYIGDNDYNWQDGILDTIEKTSKHAHSSLPTITEIPKTILGKALKFPKIHLPKIPNIISKNIEQQELSNDIEKRKKRSTHKMSQEFENRPASPILLQDGQKMLARMSENVRQRSAAPIASEISPFTDRSTNTRGEQKEPEKVLDVNIGQRSAGIGLPEFPPFTDRTTNVRGDQREPEKLLEDNIMQRSAAIGIPEFSPITDRTANARGDKKEQVDILQAQQSGQEQPQSSSTFVMNQNNKDPLICAAKTQKEIDLETQKMEELREEVRKLNEVVTLLKDQQRIIKEFSDVDRHLETNEVPEELEKLDDTVKKSYLYRTLKQLQNNRPNSAVKSNENHSKAKSLESDTSKIRIENSGPTFEDLERIKTDLRITAENLNKTKEVLIKEKRKEENLEQELKRQNSELKFLKVMTESLYDKISHKNEESKGSEMKGRNSNYEDMDVDSLLGLVHTPKTMPAPRMKFIGALTEPLRNTVTNQANQESNSKWEIDSNISPYTKIEAVRKKTEEALGELTQQGKDFHKQFFHNSKTRESTPEDNRDSNIHELLSRFSSPENIENHAKEMNQNEQGTAQNNPSKENNTYLSASARASGSGKTDDVDFKLKLLEALAKEGKTDETSRREKALNEVMKKLLVPEKKSDDDQLDSLMALLKEKRDEPKPEKKSDDDQLDSLMALLKEKRDEPKPEKSISQENLKKLFRQLNSKPQSKSDDLDVESDLRQLQKAISSLRPKEDSLLDNNFDLNNFGNIRKGKQQDGDIQSMLSQIIAQNGGGASADAGAGAGGGTNLDLSTAVDNGDGSIASGSLNVQGGGLIGPGKYTPQQLLQINKIMSAVGANNFNGGSSYGGYSNPAAQHLLNQYLGPSSSYGSPQYSAGKLNYGAGGASSYLGGHNSNFYGPNSNYGLGANSYGHYPNGYGPNSNGYGASLNSYGPNSYNPNSNAYGSNYHTYESNLYGSSPNSYAYNMHSPNLYGPYSNSYSSPGQYGPSSGSYGSSYGLSNEYDGSSSTYEAPYQGPEEYGANLHFLGPASGSNYNSYSSEPSSNYAGESIPHFTIPTLPTYDVNTPNYLASKNDYQQSYLTPGGYSAGNQGNYRNGVGYNKNTYSAPVGNYGSGSISHQYNDYSVIAPRNKGGYGFPAEHNGAAAYPSYSRQFFPSAEQSGNIGTTYQGNNYGSKGYGGSSMDQPYGNGQNGDQYRANAVASDLAKQIESLESAISGLSKNDYAQTQEDKTTVAGLEQRIYELKGVISSLNKPSYGTQQQSYQNKAPSYGSNSPGTSYTQNQGSYKPPQQAYAADHTSYGGGSSNGGSSNVYQSPYQPSAINGQTTSNAPYYGSGAAPQPSYGAGSPPQTPYSNTSPTQAPNPQPYPENKPSYVPNQPNGPNYSSSQPNQHSNSPSPPYQTGPQINTHSSVVYQPSRPTSGPPYQPKASLNDDQSMSRAIRRLRSTEAGKSRRKRQVEGTGVPQLTSQSSQQTHPQVANADMNINMRQNYGGDENNQVGYNLGDDAFTQIANTFKKYMEDNLTPTEDDNDPKQYQPSNNQENRNSAVAGLQEKLDFLKKQLASQQPSGRSFNDFFAPPAITSHIPTAAVPYGGNNYYVNHQYEAPGIVTLDKTISDKKQDIFTQIVLKILEKVLGSLPSVLHRLFGNLVSTVGGSYGDSYSPLQGLFKNLGAVGYIPLILIKLLDTVSLIVKYLGKNKFFKKFLLPAGAVAIAGAAILFIIYFYQQDEPYGYISYQGNKYDKYPQYESNPYSHKSYGSTDYGNYRSDSYDTSPNYRSNISPPPNYNSDFYDGNLRPYGKNMRVYNDLDLGGKSNFNGGMGSVPLRYSRGYYDYFENKNFNR